MSEWIHRLTATNGTTRDTEARPTRPGQPCFAGISQLIERRSDPGATVAHLVRDAGGEWRLPGEPERRAAARAAETEDAA